MSTTAVTSTSDKSEISSDTFLESIKPSKSKKSKYVSISSSSDENDVPSLDMLKSSHVQRKVDRRIKDLNQSSCDIGKLKYKSLRGGDVDVQVRHKVNWPHEAILSSVTRQRVAYDQLSLTQWVHGFCKNILACDQLSLTQWVHGFCKNILEEKSESRKDSMISYLGDLMEDTTDFSWQGAKAAHAILLCEMERGSLSWEDTDRVRRAHAQKHIPSGKQNWGRADKKPWFCKNFQTNSCPKDHEVNGRVNKHISAFCLTLGKQLNHSEKNCNSKSNHPKNEQTAAHH